MNKQVLLCADTESLLHPELIGLDGEDLFNQKWLTSFSDGAIARVFVRDCPDISEIWVISSDTIGGINLAAALKRESVNARVLLISNMKSGSFFSRTNAAGVDVVLSENDFVHRYFYKKDILSRSSLDKAEAKSDIRQFESSILNESFSEPTAKDYMEESSAKKEQLGKKSADQEDLSDSAGSSDKVAFMRNPPLSLIPDEVVDFDSLIEEPVGFPGEHHENPFLAKSVGALKKASSEDAYVLSYVSGSGGCGKSSLAVMSALMAQGRGYKTLLLDADFQFGDAGYLLGNKHAMDIAELFVHPEKIKDLAPADGFPALLCAPKNLEHSELIIAHFSSLLEFLKSRFEVIVVNTGAFWTEEHAQLLEISNQSVFVIDQRPSSVRACAHALDLCSRCGIAFQPFTFVLNYCSKQALLTSLDVSCALHGVVVHEIRDGGKDVVELLGSGVPDELLKEKNPFVESLASFLEMTIFESKKPKNEIVLAPEPKSEGFRLFKRRRRVACL